MVNDPLEFGGVVEVYDDLTQERNWMGIPYRSDATKATYRFDAAYSSDNWSPIGALPKDASIRHPVNPWGTGGSGGSKWTNYFTPSTSGSGCFGCPY